MLGHIGLATSGLRNAWTFSSRWNWSAWAEPLYFEHAGLNGTVISGLVAAWSTWLVCSPSLSCWPGHSGRILRWIHGGHAGRHLGLAPPLATIRIATPILTHRILGHLTSGRVGRLFDLLGHHRLWNA